jgi:hypothetical protein
MPKVMKGPEASESLVSIAAAASCANPFVKPACGLFALCSLVMFYISGLPAGHDALV